MEIVTGKTKRPLRTLVYGEPGVGKTTFGRLFPDPIFIGNELPDQLDVPKLTGVEMSQKGLVEAAKLLQTKTQYKTIVVDSISGIANALAKKMLASANKNQSDDKIQSIHTYGGGFARGQQVILSKISHFIDELLKCPVDDIVFIAHSRVRIIKTPGEQEISKLVPDLESQIITWFYQSSDNMFYIDIGRKSFKAGDVMKTQAVRRIYTEGSEMFMAKNRCNLKPVYDYTGRKAVEGLRQDMYKVFE